MHKYSPHMNFSTFCRVTIWNWNGFNTGQNIDIEEKKSTWHGWGGGGHLFMSLSWFAVHLTHPLHLTMQQVCPEGCGLRIQDNSAPTPPPSTGYYLLYCTWSSDSLKESTFRVKSMTANPSRTHRDRCDLLKVTFTIQNTAHSLIKWVEDERRGTQDLGVITREVDHGPNRWSIEMSVLQIIFIYLARTSDGRWAGQLEAIV